MTDTHLQRLRRSRPQDPEGRRRVLTERLRAGRERSGIPCPNAPGCLSLQGALDRKGYACLSCAGTGYRPLIEGVRLAAYVGCEVCRAVLGSDAPASRPPVTWQPQSGDSELAWWASGLSRWGREAPRRAAVAAGWVVHKTLPAHNARVRRDSDRASTLLLHGVNPALVPDAPEPVDMRETRRALEAAEAWLADPTEERRRAWVSAWLDVQGCDWLVGPDDDTTGTEPSLQQRIQAAARLATEPAVRTAVRESLVPWALGEA